MTEKQMRILSVVATLTAVGMYVSYIPQILVRQHLARHRTDRQTCILLPRPPRSQPGPQDVGYLFDKFIDNIKAAKQ